jgi:hypothetical protein
MRKLALACFLAVPLFVQGAYPPQDPSLSLDALLHDVWEQGVDKAYNLYMGKSAVPMDPAARQAFPQQMLEIADSPNLGGIILQKAQMEFYPKSHLPSPPDFDGAHFVHFMRADTKGGSIKERIYINVHPDHAAEVMRFIVAELLKPEHGVKEAKVAGPSGLQNRADSIVIYSRSLDDVDWALGRLSEYQTAHRGHFLTDLPAATRPRLIGVSTAAEPDPSLNSDSFGLYMAHAARAAMRQQPAPADFADFRKRVRAVMTADGVDPDHPDRLTRRP